MSRRALPDGFPWFWSAVGISVATLVFVGLGFWRGSALAAASYLRGDRYLLTPSTVDFGPMKPGERRTAVVQVQNLGNSPLRLVGANADCGCVGLEGVPCVAAPNGVASLSIDLRAPDHPEILDHGVRIYFDDKARPVVELRVLGVVPEDGALNIGRQGL